MSDKKEDILLKRITMTEDVIDELKTHLDKMYIEVNFEGCHNQLIEFVTKVASTSAYSDEDAFYRQKEAIELLDKLGLDGPDIDKS